MIPKAKAIDDTTTYMYIVVVCIEFDSTKNNNIVVY